MPKLFHLVLNPKAIEHYQKIYDYLTGRAGFRYILVTKHLAHEGQNYDHYHIAVQYENSIKLSAQYLYGAHNEAAEKSIQANIKYCKCEDKKHKSLGVTYELIDEKGNFKPRGGDYSVKHLLEIDNKEDLPDGRMYNTWKKLKEEKESEDAFLFMLECIEKNDLRGPEVIYFIGKPGFGKTWNAYRYALQKYDKKDICKVTINNNFFSYTGLGTKCFVIDEFRPSQLHPSSLLSFTDKYGYNSPIKGGYKYVHPECIIICSIIHPSRLYREDKEELNEQFTRRITHLFEVQLDHTYIELPIGEPVYIGGVPIGVRTSTNSSLVEVDVTDSWGDNYKVITR